MSQASRLSEWTLWPEWKPRHRLYQPPGGSFGTMLRAFVLVCVFLYHACRNSLDVSLRVPWLGAKTSRWGGKAYVVIYPFILPALIFWQKTNLWAKAGGANVSMTFKRSSSIACKARPSMRFKLLEIIALKRRDTDMAMTICSTGNSNTVWSSNFPTMSHYPVLEGPLSHLGWEISQPWDLLPQGGGKVFSIHCSVSM